MVEVLVSILVLSFGMLGMVGMQAAALQSNREAKVQSVAAVFARELGELIRGNRLVGMLPTATNPYAGDFSSPLTPTSASYCLNVATGTAACTDTAAIANAQMTEWLARVDSQLPGARVVVCFDTTPYDATTGLPQWACSGSGNAMVIKLGWTRGSTDRSVAPSASASAPAALDRAVRPAIVFPVSAGST